MSFHVVLSPVVLSNRALSRIAQGPITSLDPPQPQGEGARQCQLWYKAVVGRLLEAHHWGLATKQETLASVAVDRAGWLHAFAKPDDMAFPVSIDAAGSGAGMQYYQGVGGLIAARYGKQVFMVSGSTIYSNIAGPLNFVSFDITEADFTDTFASIVVLSLAAEIAYPITKNMKLRDKLRDEATAAMNLAITQNLNQGDNRYGEEPGEREFARGTWGLTPTGVSPDWWPGR